MTPTCVTSYVCFVCVVMCSRLDKKSIILPVYVLKTYFDVVMPMCCLMYTFIHHEGSKSTVKIKIKTDRHTVHIQ